MSAFFKLGIVVKATESTTDNILNISRAIDGLAGKIQLHADNSEHRFLTEDIQ